MALNGLGTKRKAPADSIAREVPSNKRSRHSPSEDADNAKRHCSEAGTMPHRSEWHAVNTRGGYKYKDAKEQDAEAKASLIDKGLVAKIEDQAEDSEDFDSLDKDSGSNEQGDEEKENGNDKPYDADAVPMRTSLSTRVKQFASGLENNQTSERSDDSEEDESEEDESEEDESEEDESEEESEEESISSSDEDYWSDIRALRAHRERKWQRERDRCVAELEARTSKVQKETEEAVAELSTSQGTRPIAAPLDDTGINGQWRLFNKCFLAYEFHNHRLHISKSTPEKPAHRLTDDQETQGIEFELIIESMFPKLDLRANLLLPIDAHLPDFASSKKIRWPGTYFDDCEMLLPAEHDSAYERFFVDMVFLGNGYLKLYLPAFLFETSSAPNSPGQLLGPGEDTSVIEFVGRKDLPRHLEPRLKTPPSPKGSYGGWLAGYNS